MIILDFPESHKQIVKKVHTLFRQFILKPMCQEAFLTASGVFYVRQRFALHEEVIIEIYT